MCKYSGNGVALSGLSKRLLGFTLIELILVIAILGVLAAIALPRFANVQGDARQAAIESIAGSLSSIDQQVYAKSVLLGIQDNDRNPTTTDRNPQGGFYLNGNFIWTIHGRPWLFNGSTLTNLMDVDVKYEGINSSNKVCDYDGEFCVMVFNGSAAPTRLGVSFQPGGALVVYFPDDAVDDDCFAYHIFDRSDNSSIIGSITTGCD